MKTLTLPESAKKVIYEYTHLPLGGKEIVTPYYMNPKSQRGGLRVLVGKGDPGEIAREVKVLSQLKGLDLTKLSATEIRAMMIDNHIGIDCSGFIVHIMNYWLKMQNDRILVNYLKFKNNSIISRLKRTFRPVEQIGANLLTNSENCKVIHDLNEIRPGDLIRAKGQRKNSHHVMLVTEVTFEEDGVKEIEYVHSTRNYGEENGVRFGKILISDPKEIFYKQTWTEIKDGRNWTYEGLMNEVADNGFRRLKNIKLNFVTS